MCDFSSVTLELTAAFAKILERTPGGRLGLIRFLNIEGRTCSRIKNIYF